MGIKIDVKKTVEVEARELHILMKVVDEFSARLLDQDGVQIGDDYEGYVPSSMMPDTCGGDYLDLRIDLETGKILNWKVPTKENIERFLSKEEE